MLFRSVNKYAVTLYNAAKEYINENVPKLKIAMTYSGNNKALVTLWPLSDSLIMNYSIDGSTPSTSRNQYDKPFEVSLPATITAIAHRNNAVAGSKAYVSIPLSFGKAVSIFPLPAEKYKSNYGATLTDGVRASEKINDGHWLGYEGDNLTALLTLEGKYKISKVSFGYLENGYNQVFAPHSVIVETSANGIDYVLAGVHDFDDNKWSMVAQKGALTISFPETEAAYVRLLFFNRGVCPETIPAAGKKAWMFLDEITVE